VALEARCRSDCGRFNRSRVMLVRASVYADPRALPQCFCLLCIIKNLWQPGEPCKLLKTLNIYGLKGHCSRVIDAALMPRRLRGLSWAVRRAYRLPVLPQF
jgi:hypothetical protein